ncbi:MAG: prepilin peptidase [Calditrichaeota bacterium]|nr:MAG: prepilin peptidase [Calditrichota bacterium]
MLRGRCHACRRPIPSRYPLVEIISAALTLATYWRFGLTAPFFFYLIFIYFLIVISFIDLDTQLIHNRLLLTLLISGVALNAVLAVHPWKESFLGFLVGGGTLLACAILGKLLFHKEALGMGDVKLAAVAGFFLGWKMVVYALGFSFFLTLILLILALPFTRWRWGQYIPFGPFLALGWIIFVYWGSQLVRWYWQYLIVYPG